MTGRAHIVYLPARKCADADDLRIFRGMAFRGLAEHANMFTATPMTGFAIDPRFRPCRSVGVSFQVVIGRKLTDMAAVT